MTFLFMGVTGATANPIEPNGELRSEIESLIGREYLGDYEFDDFSVEVLFTINSKREVIVLFVESENKEARTYFKRRLNYKKVGHLPDSPGEIFLLPVKVRVP